MQELLQNSLNVLMFKFKPFYQKKLFHSNEAGTGKKSKNNVKIFCGSEIQKQKSK